MRFVVAGPAAASSEASPNHDFMDECVAVPVPHGSEEEGELEETDPELEEEDEWSSSGVKVRGPDRTAGPGSHDPHKLWVSRVVITLTILRQRCGLVSDEGGTEDGAYPHRPQGHRLLLRPRQHVF